MSIIWSPRRWARRVLRLLRDLLPERFFYADRFTTSARRLFIRLTVASSAIVIAAVTAGLLSRNNFVSVMAGALFAWATSVVVWSVSSYRSQTEVIRDRLRHSAEFDLLHARVNHFAAKARVPIVNLDEADNILEARGAPGTLRWPRRVSTKRCSTRCRVVG